MDDFIFPDAPAERVFRPRASAPRNTTLLLLGGFFAIGMAGLGFVVAIIGRVGALNLQLMTTLPLLIGIGAISAGWKASRAPDEVAVGPEGVRIAGNRGAQLYRWEQIGWATVQPIVLSAHKQMTLFDVEGRPLAKFTDSLEDFEALDRMIQQRLAARRDGTTERVQMSKARRNAVFLAASGVFFMLIAGANVWMAYGEQRAARLLKERAVPGAARIQRRFLAPNGVTPRLEYEVRAPDGKTATRNAEVERAYWESLAEKTTVPVRYVPGEPGISRLMMGEVEKSDPADRPVVAYGLSAVMGLISIFSLVAAVLSWRGLDIDLDSKTGKISIKRYGTGR